MKQDFHVFQGMRQDNHPIKQDSKYLWEAHNIRFTARDDSTFMSITNERGPKLIEDITFTGNYIGHCVVGKYLIVFTGSKSPKTNYIFRVYYKDDTLIKDTLYEGDLNMDEGHPLQTLAIYEGDLVQKVYWVDGVNQPRYINVVADKLLGKELSESTMHTIYPLGTFDFVPSLNLEEEVSVSRIETDGSFEAGIIQYAFTYYNKYGAESNIFYNTPLLNVSFNTRGGSPEEKCSNSFKITISNLDNKFQYLRIYSIHRTSLNATPTVKNVADIEIQGKNTVTYIDRGNTGATEDPTKLLYIGGESIYAGTITNKDNTLFLGDITLERDNNNLKSLKDYLKDLRNNNEIKVETKAQSLKYKNNIESFYNYENHLKYGNYSTFKIHNKYRLGFQLQYKNGKWTEPIFLTDYKVPLDSKTVPNYGQNILHLASLDASDTFKENTNLMASLYAKGYKHIRPLVVLPNTEDKLVLAQGVVCPTVFSVKSRFDNAPFSQSSWFFRPFDNGHNNKLGLNNGATVSYGHLDALKSGDDRGAEIQNMDVYTFTEANNKVKNSQDTNINTFFVDQSIVTFHSPDIDFNDEIKRSIDGNDSLELDIVGAVSFTNVAGDISIETSSPVPALNDTGFYHKSVLNEGLGLAKTNKGLVAGMFYKSHPIDEKNDGKDYYPYKDKDSSWELNWLIYPWHRSGSLNNDAVRPSNGGTRTSVLKRKVLSNLRVSPTTFYFKDDLTLNPALKIDINETNIFDSNEVSLVKVKTPSIYKNTSINYYGNIDTLVTSDNEFDFFVVPNTNVKYSYTLNGKDYTRYVRNPFTQTPLTTVKNMYTKIGDKDSTLAKLRDPVRMKYKSTPHAVFSLGNTDDNKTTILPSLTVPVEGSTIPKNFNVYSGKAEKYFWEKKNDIEIKDITNVQYNQVQRLEDGVNVTERMIEILNALYPTSNKEYALGTCSSAPSDETKADLYKSTNGKWALVTLTEKDNNKLYKVDNIELLYIVKKYGSEPNTSYILELMEDTSVNGFTQKNILFNSTTVLNNFDENQDAFLYLAELRRKTEPSKMFGGDPDEGYKDNIWIVAGDIGSIKEDGSVTLEYTKGDTYFQRYDCLKTYPFTTEDENSIVEIASFMCETYTNIDGRYDKNRGQLSNLNMSPTNFNLINPVYSQKDNFFNYRILDEDFYKNTKYQTQVLWSLEKTNMEDVDPWTSVTLANSIDLNGNAGKLTSLETFNELLIAFQEKSISQILFNERVQIPTSDGTPIEISNNYKVEGVRKIQDSVGCNNKFKITKSPYGIYFIDDNNKAIYLFNGKLKDLSNTLGLKSWVNNYGICDTNNALTYKEAIGVRLSYDPINKDVYFSPMNDIKNCNTLCYSEQLETFTSFMSYSNSILFPFEKSFWTIKSEENVTQLYENFKGDYNNFYGKIIYPRFTYISNSDPTYSKIFDTIEYRADIYDANNTLLNNESFNIIRAANEYQDSGVKNFSQNRRVIDDISLRKKFRVWRGQIPRDGRARIQNPWTSISLGFTDKEGRDSNFKLVFHDISTKYTI